MNTPSPLSLDGDGWTLCFGPQAPDSPADFSSAAAAGWHSVQATVPGNVELDLIRAGRLPPDLERGDNIFALRTFETYRWFYRREFVTPGLLAESDPVLRFEGIDCIATVFLNGEAIGQSTNMLIAHGFEVSRWLRPPGETNELVVRIDSAVLAGRSAPIDPICYAGKLNWESLRIRKAPHMYGWDILPRVVSAGLWRSVALDLRPRTRFRSLAFATPSVDPTARTAECFVDWDLVTDAIDLEGWRVEISLEGPGGHCVKSITEPVFGSHGRARFTLSDAALWWPRGAGEQPLYRLRLILVDDLGRAVASSQTRVGLRTVALHRTDTTDSAGSGEFVFVVNGRRIYARGTNHVPLDSLHSRDPQHLAGVVEMLADLNCNMVRCWGGNVYEDHAFFDACDEKGILVWQDFALACALYPQDAEFAEQMRLEARAVVLKLRNHPSLALWAGNNEIDDLIAVPGWGGLGMDPNEVDVISRRVLPEVTRALDPFRPYLPSSPYRGPGLSHSDQKPEDHLWGPRDDYKGSFYSSSNAHFVSEIGYHGCPDRASLEQMMDPGHLWPWQENSQWLTHATRNNPDDPSYSYRIQLMANQAALLFGSAPESLDDFVFASQASQAEAMKYFVEQWRMGKWRRTGMLWWNLRDGWPVISDAIVDYYGRRKLAYDYLWRAQRDVIACVAEPSGFQQRVVLVNDTQSDVEATVSVRDAATGEQLLKATGRVPRDGVVTVGHVPEARLPACWLIALELPGGGALQRSHHLAGPRPVELGVYRRWMSMIEGEPRR